MNTKKCSKCSKIDDKDFIDNCFKCNIQICRDCKAVCETCQIVLCRICYPSNPQCFICRKNRVEMPYDLFSRICKEGEKINEERYSIELKKRQLQRSLVVEKYTIFLYNCDIIPRLNKNDLEHIKFLHDIIEIAAFRKTFKEYVKKIMTIVFVDEEHEYQYIYEPGRCYTDSSIIEKNFTKSEILIVKDIMFEFNCSVYWKDILRPDRMTLRRR